MGTPTMWDRLAGAPQASLSRQAAGFLGEGAAHCVASGGETVVVAGSDWPGAAMLPQTHGVVADGAWLLATGSNGGFAAAASAHPERWVAIDPDPGATVHVRVASAPAVLAELLQALADRVASEAPAAAAAFRAAAGAVDGTAGPGSPEPREPPVVAALLSSAARLDGAGEQQRVATERLLDEAERERGRMATWLHDGPVQDLTAALLLTDAASADLPEGQGGRLVAATEALRRAITAVRGLMEHLAPDLLVADGLQQAASAAVAAVAGSDARCDVVLPDDLAQEHPEAVVAAYRALCALLDTATGPLERATITSTDEALTVEVVGPGIADGDVEALQAAVLARRGRCELRPGHAVVELPFGVDSRAERETGRGSGVEVP